MMPCLLTSNSGSVARGSEFNCVSSGISVTIMPMFIAFFSWWYGNGWQQVVGSFRPRIRTIAENFSVTQLLRTLFAPWKRIITQPGRSLEARFRAAGDNAFSRCIGFIIRVGVLLAALVCVVVVALLTIIEIIVWPLLPLAVPGFIIAGLVR